MLVNDKYDSAVVKISQAAPVILRNSDYEHAFWLVTSGDMPDRDLWLPEALVLFNTKGLDHDHRKAMVKSVFGEVPAGSIQGIINCAERVGLHGFSFPEWRFLTQSFNGASLVERFGMTKLQRKTDMRDAALPPPDCFELGAGFVPKDDREPCIELRQAYKRVTLAGEHPCTLIIRNSSYYFGRDRLRHSAYVSWKSHTEDQLRAITAECLESDSSFVPLNKVLQALAPEEAPEKLKRISRAIDVLDTYERDFNFWLFENGGIEELKAFLRYKLEHIQGQPPLYVCEIENTMPPWCPFITIALNRSLLENAKLFAGAFSLSGRTHPVLLSGPDGDLPVPEC